MTPIITTPRSGCQAGIPGGTASRATISIGVAGGRREATVAKALVGSRTTLTQTNIGNMMTSVTGVSIANIDAYGSLGINLAGLTMDQQDLQPQCIRPGYSCNTPAAANSQAAKWQPTVPGAAPTAATTPHANNGIGQGVGGGKGHKAQ